MELRGFELSNIFYIERYNNLLTYGKPLLSIPTKRVPISQRLFINITLVSLKTIFFQHVIFEDNEKSIRNQGSRRINDKQYSFDVVFGEESSQEEVYDVTTSSLVKDVLSG